MSKPRTAQPFDGLMGLVRKHLPASACVTVVVAGKPVDDVRQIEARLIDAERDDIDVAEARRLRTLVKQAKKRAQEQRQQADPAVAQRNRAWELAHPERMRELQVRWRKRNRDRLRVYSADWARAAYLRDPETYRERARAYYAANAERVKARVRAKRAADRAAAAAAAPATQGQQA